MAGGPYSAFSRIRYIMEERVMDGVNSLMWTLFFGQCLANISLRADVGMFMVQMQAFTDSC